MIHTGKPRRLAVIRLQGTDTTPFYSAPPPITPAAAPQPMRTGPPVYCESSPAWMTAVSLLITGVALLDIFMRFRKNVSQ